MEKYEKIIDAFTELAPRYATTVDTELTRFWGWSYEGFVGHLLDTVHIGKYEIILDVATGTGTIPLQLERKGLPRNRIHELDITFTMLKHARRRLEEQDDRVPPNLSCASAMAMPYRDSSFTQVICALATHHMDVSTLLVESYRVLMFGGTLTMADVGGSKHLQSPIIKFLARVFAFFYFLLSENITRAWAESSAVSNVLSAEDWQQALRKVGFHKIQIQKLRSRHFWVPSPLLIIAEK